MTRVLITGATSGLGLATARALRDRGVEVWATGRDPVRLRELDRTLGVRTVLVDHRSLREVVAASARLPQLDAVVGNAGVQRVKDPRWTEEGLEETVAVNHLSHLALVDALVAAGRTPAVVVLIGSATHDPDRRTGTPAPLEGPIGDIAFPGGAVDPSGRAGLATYTTTKLMGVATSAALAREQPGSWVVAFDPGLMVDTRLGREHPLVLRALYRSVLRGTSLLPFASSSRRSGDRLAHLLLEAPVGPSGSYLDHRLRPQQPSRRARDVDYQTSLLADSRQIIQRVLRNQAAPAVPDR